MSGWPLFAAVVLGSIIGTGGLAGIILALARRPVLHADATVKLSEEQRRWVDDFRATARDAQAVAERARDRIESLYGQVDELQGEVNRVYSEARQVTRYLGRVLMWIETPGMDVERLRQLVADSGAPPAISGRGRPALRDTRNE